MSQEEKDRKKKIKQLLIKLPEFVRNNDFNNIIHYSEGAFLMKKEVRPEFYKRALECIKKMNLNVLAI